MVRVTVWIRFWYEFDMVLKFCRGFWWVGWLPQKEAEPAQGHFLRISPRFLWFWHRCDTVLIWFRHVGFSKRKQKQSRKMRFLVDFRGFDKVLIRFWYDFDTILLRFWYDFVTILLRFWYDFDSILSRFWYDFVTILIRFRIWFDGLASNSTILTDGKNHQWNYIKIVTETYWNHIKIISAKPNHKRIVTANRIWNVSKS